MSWTQADIDALKKQLASGAKSVRAGENSVDYITPTEARQLLREMEAEVKGTSGVSISRPVFNRGL